MALVKPLRAMVREEKGLNFREYEKQPDTVMSFDQKPFKSRATLFCAWPWPLLGTAKMFGSGAEIVADHRGALLLFRTKNERLNAFSTPFKRLLVLRFGLPHNDFRSSRRGKSHSMSPDPFSTLPPFDLEVLLPVFPSGRWLQRLEAFRRFGLLGGKQLRVRLVLLAGTHKLDSELQSVDAWDGITEVVVVPGPHDHPAPKIYDYYANVLPEQGLLARWYLRVDDDSLTDLYSMMRYLDGTFNWHDPLHLAGALGKGIGGDYAALLREVDGSRFLGDNGVCQVFHEGEASITSAETMRRILENRDALELLRRAANVPRGYGDLCLALAARLCGVPASPLPLMTAHCQLDEFTAFTPSGNGFFHIHYLSPDNPEMWTRYMDKRRERGLSTEAG